MWVFTHQRSDIVTCLTPSSDGNTLLLLATSGMSSGGVVLTGGQYGFATSGTSVGLPAFHEPRADLLG